MSYKSTQRGCRYPHRHPHSTETAPGSSVWPRVNRFFVGGPVYPCGMPSKGPAPRPAALRALHGMPDVSTGPVAAQVPVEAPAGLSAAARAVWDQLAPDLIGKFVVDAWAADAFGRYCWLRATSAALRASLDAEGYIVAGARDGEPVKNKLWPVLRQIDAELLQLEGRFGLTPADRGRVNPVEADAPFDSRDPARLLT